MDVPIYIVRFQVNVVLGNQILDKFLESIKKKKKKSFWKTSISKIWLY